MPSPVQIRKEITDRIIAALEAGTVPWKRPWAVSRNAGRPANIVSKRTYSGINPLLCELHRLRYSFSSRWFGTFEQIKSLGGIVKKRPDDVPPGEWGCRVVFFRRIEKTVKDKTTGEQKLEEIPLLRTYTIFSVDQCDGDSLDRFRTNDIAGHGAELQPSFEAAEELIEASGADIRHGGEQAYYRPPTPEGTWPHHDEGDYIVVPERKRFIQVGRYYETVLHELAHHSEIRLGHDRSTQPYAFWELVAEMSASFLSTELGVPDNDDDSNHIAYLKHWLTAMHGDSGFIFRASSLASKTTDYLLSKLTPKEAEVVAVGDEHAEHVSA